MAPVQVSARVDEGIKRRASYIVAQNGLELSDAIRIFVTKIANERRLPLEINQPIVSLNGDEFASDMEYFAQIPGYLDSIRAALDEDPNEMVDMREIKWIADALDS